MLFLLSPAKTLDYDTPTPAALARKASDPVFNAQAAALIDVLKRKSAAQVAALMDLSPALAQLNVARYAAWQAEPSALHGKPAALAFNGDVYAGLKAATLTTADMTWAQQHLVILSGLYGALRPLDRLQPYRLEMGTALKTRQGKDLYAYWGDTVVQYLNQRQQQERSPVIVNLASQEYARVVLRPGLLARVVECRFEDFKAGQYKVISFFAKQARGTMARWAVQQRVGSVARLRQFEQDGYAYERLASKANQLVFRRHLG